MGHTSTSTSFYLVLIFFLFTCHPTATSATLEKAPSDNEGVCSSVNCMEGTCVPSNSSILHFECQCFGGWRKFPPFPACFLPNCTISFECGNGAPPPPTPPLPPFNPFDPCNLVFCGDGHCVANGTSHICQCNDGSGNLFDNTLFPCIKQCYLGADCHDIPFGQPSPPPPPSTSGSPGNGMSPLQSPTPPGSMKGGVSASLRIPTALAVIFLAAAFLTSV